MKSVNVSLLAGHDIGVKGCYYKYMSKETEVLSDFMTNCADVLTIDPNQRLQQKVQELEGQQAQEIVQLRQKVKDMEGQRSEEIAILNARIEKLDEWMKYLDEERTNAYCGI